MCDTLDDYGTNSDIVTLKQIDIPEETMASLATARKAGYPLQAEPPTVAALEGTVVGVLVEWKVGT